MTRLPLALITALLLLTALLTLGCGGPQLKSVTISPSTADAKNFANGQVPFVATGIYSGSSKPVQLSAANHIMWCVGSSNGECAGFINPGASVGPDGLAACLSSTSSTVTILAGTVSSAMPGPDAGQTLKVFGSAQLTCP